ncbi:hypothetical protein V6N13_118497 [Hibiscus sabdariffa]|uniref:Uncharacterized protein n=2 Tax=Hibiscus sabdariffa TaxID=183260 RepID=A0ABR2BTH4_9ROSI
MQSPVSMSTDFIFSPNFGSGVEVLLLVPFSNTNAAADCWGYVLSTLKLTFTKLQALSPMSSFGCCFPRKSVGTADIAFT